MGNAAAVDAARRGGVRAGEPEERDRRYSWVEDYLPTLEGKEAREEYYARLECEAYRRRDGGSGVGLSDLPAVLRPDGISKPRSR